MNFDNDISDLFSGFHINTQQGNTRNRELYFAALISVSVSSPSAFLDQYAPHQAFDCFSVYCTVAHLL